MTRFRRVGMSYPFLPGLLPPTQAFGERLQRESIASSLHGPFSLKCFDRNDEKPVEKMVKKALWEDGNDLVRADVHESPIGQAALRNGGKRYER